MTPGICPSPVVKGKFPAYLNNMYDQKEQVCLKQVKDFEFLDKVLRSDLSIKQEHEAIHTLLKGKRGYNRKSFKSHGFCWQCIPTDLDKFEPKWMFLLDDDGEFQNWGHKSKHCKNPPYCTFHCTLGHHPSKRCERYCSNCLMYGHTMQFCRKIKNCVLCGKKGHNPHSCWEYNTMMQWLRRTTDLKLCPECLTPSVEGDKDCRHCMQRYIQWSPYYTQQNSRETQTEVNDCIDQEKQEEIDWFEYMKNQKQQIEDLEDKLSSRFQLMNA